MWNRCSRRILKLPYKTHTRFLPQLLGMPSSMEQIMSRFVNVVKVMLCSDNRTVNYLAKHCIARSGSIMNINLFQTCTETGLEIEQLLNCSKRCKITANKYQCSFEDLCAIKAVKELKNDNLNDWTIADCVNFLNFICCN